MTTDLRDDQARVRLSKLEKREIEANAMKAGFDSISEFMRSLALQRKSMRGTRRTRAERPEFPQGEIAAMVPLQDERNFIVQRSRELQAEGHSAQTALTMAKAEWRNRK